MCCTFDSRKKDLKNLWSSNVDGTENIVNAAKEYNVNKIVFISTNCLWGQNFDEKVTEEEIPNPIEIYGKSKLAAEKILLSAKDSVNSVIFRCPTIMDEGRLGLLGISPLCPYQYKMICSNFIFDTTKIKQELGFTSTLKNEEMLLKAYEYYKNNKNAILSRKNVSAHNQVAKMGIIKLIKMFS